MCLLMARFMNLLAVNVPAGLRVIEFVELLPSYWWPMECLD